MNQKSYTFKNLVFVCMFFCSMNTFGATRNWTGAGAGGTGTDLNDAGNWDGSGAILSTDDLVIALTSGTTLTLSANLVVNDLTVTLDNGSGVTTATIDANNFALTINGTASFDAVQYIDASNRDQINLETGTSPGEYIFNGTVDFMQTGGGDMYLFADDAAPGKITFYSDVSFGNWIYTSPAIEPILVFDALVAQTVSCSQLSSYTMGSSVIIGVLNTPSVSFTNTSWRMNVYDGSLTISDGCIVDLAQGGFDNFLGNGPLTLGAGAKLRIGSTYTFPGDNITGFNDFTIYTLDPTSTVEYYGTNQTIKSDLAYGNLVLSGSGTKTSAGNFSIAGNFTNDATFANGNDIHTFNGTENQLISGSTSPTTFYTLAVNKSSGTLTSDIDLAADNSLQMDAGTFLVDGETITANNIIDINGGTLQITSGTIALNSDTNDALDQDGGTFDIDGGTVNIGTVASQGNTDYNLDGGILDISTGTLTITDELDVNGGTLSQSGGTINIKAHTGSEDGSAASKFDVSGGTITISDGDIYILGAYDESSTYPALNFTGGTFDITGGTIHLEETGSSDENFYISPNGNAVNNLNIDKTSSGSSTADIWFEDFEDLSSGIESDAGTTAWSIGCTGGATACGYNDGSSNDYFYVLSTTFMNGNRAFVGRDMDNEALWTSELITITGYTNVGISIELDESGGDNNADYINCYYSVDGGAQTLLTNGAQSGNFNGATATASGLSGTTLQIFVYMKNNGGSDYGLFDDVHVTGETAIAAQTLSLSSTTTVNGDLTIANGTLDASAANSAINLAGNWVNNGTFNPQQGTVTLNGSSTQSISSGGTAESFYNLVLNNSSATGIQLNDDIEISNLLTFTDGVVAPTGNELVHILSGATVSGASDNSYVDGQVRKTGNTAANFPFSFPVGDGGNYQAIIISRPSAATDHFTAQYFMSDPGEWYDNSLLAGTMSYISNCEYWILDRTNGTSNVEVSLTWDSNSCGVANLCDLSVARWNGSSWADHGNGGTSGTTSAGTVVSGSDCSTPGTITDFSPFTLASVAGLNPLPVELVSFTATKDNDVVNLLWETATERNNDYFVVQRSLDGKVFEDIIWEKGQGNSNVLTSYENVDLYPNPGMNYYRLKQVDLDGQESTSKVQMVEFDSDAKKDLLVYPNPAKGVVNIEGLEGNGEILLFDRTGKLQKSLTVNQTSKTQLDISGLSTGVYLLKYTGSLTAKSVKLIVSN